MGTELKDTGLAAREECKLVTADDRLVSVLQTHFPFVVELAAAI